MEFNWVNQNSSSATGFFGSGLLRRSLLTLLLIIYSQLTLNLWYIVKERKDNLDYIKNEDIYELITSGYIAPGNINSDASKFILFNFLISIVLMKIIPGRKCEGPITPNGHIPIYKNNGVLSFFIHLFIFISGGLKGYYNLSIIYDLFGDIINFLNYFALVFVLFLYFKGRFFPSTKDNGISGNFLFDCYWGTELYPRIFDIDVKQFVNCRFGMVFWALTVISCSFANIEKFGYITNSMLVTLIPQMIYITKFFIWEEGYFKSIDIMQDRAGYYIIWGCLVYVPSFYTLVSIYMVDIDYIENNINAILIILFSLLAIWCNYDADNMRFNFRKKNGCVKIWGKKAVFLIAKYRTVHGEEKENLLLLSGWWGMARHTHYIFEILGAFLWSCGDGFNSIIPYFYVIFLSCLLLDRSYRDDSRCESKYGEYWRIYCQMVPYKIIPGLF